MQFRAIKLLFVSKTRAAIAQLREIRRERRARAALKDLSQHLLADIGQGHYGERKELEQDQLGRSGYRFGW